MIVGRVPRATTLLTCDVDTFKLSRETLGPLRPPGVRVRENALTTTASATTAPLLRGPRLGARVLLLDSAGRVLLVPDQDPAEPDRQWWELPGGDRQLGESPQRACRRELAELAGVDLDEVGPCVWIREAHLRYAGADHWRMDSVHVAFLPERYERAHWSPPNLPGRALAARWWSALEIQQATHETFQPERLADLLDHLLRRGYPSMPLQFSE